MSCASAARGESAGVARGFPGEEGAGGGFEGGGEVCFDGVGFFA